MCLFSTLYCVYISIGNSHTFNRLSTGYVFSVHTNFVSGFRPVYFVHTNFEHKKMCVISVHTFLTICTHKCVFIRPDFHFVHTFFVYFHITIFAHFTGSYVHFLPFFCSVNTKMCTKCKKTLAISKITL